MVKLPLEMETTPKAEGPPTEQPSKGNSNTSNPVQETSNTRNVGA